MIFILTRTKDGVALDRIVVTSKQVIFRSYSDQTEHDYERDITETTLGLLLLKTVVV
jgi:hypothetical protein